MAQPQTYKNHVRRDPVYHIFVVTALLLNIIVTSIYFGRNFAQYGYTAVWWIFISISLFLLAIKARIYALRVQDRVIRVEERMRLASLVSAEELIELESLTTDQYIGLRFASNAELPDLARRAVRENLNRKQIKMAIVAWRPDVERV